jgi:uncharacterized protein YbgA (DUF1722 family)
MPTKKTTIIIKYDDDDDDDNDEDAATQGMCNDKLHTSNFYKGTVHEARNQRLIESVECYEEDSVPLL